jgi:hypothetical protein
VTVRAAWLLPEGQTRTDTRLAPLGTMTPAGELTTRPGVLAGGDPLAATGVSTMQVQIGTGRAIVQGTVAQGAYPVAVTEPETLTIDDGNAQYDRVDTVIMRVYDGLYDAEGQTAATVEIISGAPDPAPEPPALPPAALPLWDIAVPAGASAGTGGIDWASALTDRRDHTTAHGGITARGMDPTTPGSYVGQYRDTGEWLQRWDGETWRAHPPRPQWQSWTPAWTSSSGTNHSSFGNATLNCRYVQHGPTVHLSYLITFGSTTTFAGGTGDNWLFSLPVPAAGSQLMIGYAQLAGSASRRMIARVYCYDSTRFALDPTTGLVGGDPPDNTGAVDAVTPWTWSSVMAIRGMATYEAAG